MASMLLRSLARTSTKSRLLHRTLSTTPTLRQAEALPTEAKAKNVFDYHTVEDLHGMAAADILADPVSRPDSKMRHFTGKHTRCRIGKILTL